MLILSRLLKVKYTAVPIESTHTKKNLDKKGESKNSVDKFKLNTKIYSNCPQKGKQREVEEQKKRVKE